MNSGRLARNTVALFLRQLIILAISLYSIRVLLAALGVTDFALFNVIVNLVTIGSFLPTALATITQRYLAFAIGKGKGDDAGVKRVHDASLLLCAGVSVLVFLGLETVGAWFVAHHLVVPPGRLFTAQLLFHLIVFSYVGANFSGFYSSIIMAHEEMHVFALFSVAEAILRLGAALAISFATDGLIHYGVSLCVISFGIVGAYWIFCNRRYPECRWGGLQIEKATLREMSSFAGWTIFGQLTTISRNQMVTILINQAFSPATVAARALASSVAAQALVFSTNFSAALHPPIIKAHAADEREQMFSLVIMGSKIAFFLIWIVTLPLLAVMPWVLNVWLDNYPLETVLFTRLALIENAIMAISLTLMTAVRATGKLQLYELSLGLLQAMVLLISWLLARAGYPAYSVYLVAIAINIVMFAVRLAITSHLTGLHAGVFLRRVGLPVVLVVGVSTGLVGGIFWLMPDLMEFKLRPASIAALMLICMLPVGVVYALGMSGEERRSLHAMIRKRRADLGSGR